MAVFSSQCTIQRPSGVSTAEGKSAQFTKKLGRRATVAGGLQRPSRRLAMRRAKRPLSRGSNQVASSPPEGVAVRNGLALPAGPAKSSVGVRGGAAAEPARSVTAIAQGVERMRAI